MQNWMINGDNVTDFQNYRWWAENGMIRWEHKDTGNFGTIKVRTALERLRGLNDMLSNSVLDSHEGGPKLLYNDEIEKLQKYIDSMIQICKRAREQGTPDDESACRDLKRRRKRQFHVNPSPRALF